MLKGNKYGQCSVCGTWVLRSEMRAANILLFSKGRVGETEDVFRFRLCDKCMDKQVKAWTHAGDHDITWNAKLKSKEDLEEEGLL